MAMLNIMLGITMGMLSFNIHPRKRGSRCLSRAKCSIVLFGVAAGEATRHGGLLLECFCSPMSSATHGGSSSSLPMLIGTSGTSKSSGMSADVAVGIGACSSMSPVPVPLPSAEAGPCPCEWKSAEACGLFGVCAEQNKTIVKKLTEVVI